MLRPVHWWIWSDFERRLCKLLRFAEVEADGGRDIPRAAEVTTDPLLRRLYVAHAIDKLHHADLFRQRGAAAFLQARSPRSKPFSQASWLPADARAPSRDGLAGSVSGRWCGAQRRRQRADPCRVGLRARPDRLGRCDRAYLLRKGLRHA